MQRIYHGTLEFFFDAYGGCVIGAVWDPSIVDERPFRVLADYSTMPSVSGYGPIFGIEGRILITHQETDEGSKRKSRGTVVPNQAAVLAEIRRLGEGLVKSIEVQHTEQEVE